MKVKSSHINEVFHDAEKNTLTVVFHSGAKWNYSPVTEQAFKEMTTAESVGKWFFANIKNNENITAKEVTYDEN
jgi:hypothetical protein